MCTRTHDRIFTPFVSFTKKEGKGRAGKEGRGKKEQQADRNQLLPAARFFALTGHHEPPSSREIFLNNCSIQ